MSMRGVFGFIKRGAPTEAQIIAKGQGSTARNRHDIIMNDGKYDVMLMANQTVPLRVKNITKN